jgi:hypothetical protein
MPNNCVFDESFPAINAAIIPRMAVSASPNSKNLQSLVESTSPNNKTRLGTAKSVLLIEPPSTNMDSTGLYFGSAITEKRPEFKYRGVSARMDARRPLTSEALLFPRLQRMQNRVKELEGFIVEDIVKLNKLKRRVRHPNFLICHDLIFRIMNFKDFRISREMWCSKYFTETKKPRQEPQMVVAMNNSNNNIIIRQHISSQKE